METGSTDIPPSCQTLISTILVRRLKCCLEIKVTKQIDWQQYLLDSFSVTKTMCEKVFILVITNIKNGIVHMYM